VCKPLATPALQSSLHRVSIARMMIFPTQPLS